MNWSGPEVVFPMVGIVFVSLIAVPFFQSFGEFELFEWLAILLANAAPNVGVALAVVYGVQRVTQ